MRTIKNSLLNRQPLALFLILTLAIWSLGLPFWMPNAFAAQLTSIKDTITDSDVSATANHTIQYTSPNQVDASETIKIQFDPTTDAFDLGTLAFADMTFTGATLVSACGAGTDEVTVAVDATAPDENVTFTVCAGDTVSSGAKTIVLGNNKITNPSSTGSYVIRITSGTPTDKGDTRVAIIDDVTVTASVATNFTFTVAGVASGQTAANGESGTTDVTTTSTSIPWSDLTPGTPKKARQDLAVTTNAKNGFTVTIWQDQNLTSSNGADIDNFQQSATSTPVAWTAPASDLDDETTWGHQGVTTEDTSLSGGDTYGSALYSGVGSQSSPVEIFFHTGPANGTTADKGATKVGFKIEIASTQEAADDYTQSLTYIATPIF